MDPATLDAVDAVFADFHRQGKSPGMSYGVVVDGNLVHSGAVGSADVHGSPLHADSVMRIASMTKSFTAAAALLLRDEDALRLDEPIGTYVPELAALRLPTDDSPPLTTRLLLTMSGGLPTDDPWADREESMPPDHFSQLLTDGLSFTSTPGTAFQYSNLGYVIVGRAIANIAGQRYHDFVRSRLIEPLGLTSTGFDVSDVAQDHLAPGHHRRGDEWAVEPIAAPGEFSPLGGVFSTVRDLTTWIGGFTDAFADDSSRPHPLSRPSRREMQQLQRFSDVTVPNRPASSNGPEVRARAIGYGLGLAVTHDTRWGQIVGHSGGYPGYGSNMRWHPLTGIGVVALGNARYVSASEPAAAALEVLLAARQAPSGRVVRWRRADELRLHAERLLLSWDDALADEIFSANMDADLPRADRRAQAQRVVEQLGAVGVPDQRTPSISSPSAAEIVWWIRGEHGRARIELTLTPHATPLVQEMKVQFVADPPAALQRAAEDAAARLAPSDAAAPAEIECVASGDGEATFVVRHGVDEWKVALTIDPDDGTAVTEVITPTPPSVHRFDESVAPR